MYLSLPIIAGAIGWFTNWVAIKMLFYPRKKVKFLFFEIQGVFPKRQAMLAERIGQMVSEELLTTDDIRNSINNPDGIVAIQQSVGAKVEEYIEQTFPSRYPFLSLLMSRKMKDKFKEDFKHEVDQLAPALIDNYVNSLGDQLDFGKVVRQRITILSPHALENMMMSMLKTEFQFVEVLGGVVGFFIGVIQVAIVLIEQHMA